MFTDRDTNILITSYVHKKDIISLIKTNRRLRGDLFYVPYKSFKFDYWLNMDMIKTFVSCAKYIEKLTIDRCDLYIQFMISLPKLKKIKVEECNLSDFNMFEFYAPSLRKITINRCKLESQNFCTKNFHRLRSLSINKKILKFQTK